MPGHPVIDHGLIDQPGGPQPDQGHRATILILIERLNGDGTIADHFVQMIAGDAPEGLLLLRGVDTVEADLDPATVLFHDVDGVAIGDLDHRGRVDFAGLGCGGSDGGQNKPGQER